MCLVHLLIKRTCSPVNVSATQKDISHLLQIVKPTHIATIAPKLDDVQAALASNSMAQTKVSTVLSKVENLPQVSDLLFLRAYILGAYCNSGYFTYMQ